MDLAKACFEVGIKLGALFHQFIGLPISPKNVELIEKAIESCVKLQPHVVDVKVAIDRKKLENSLSALGYTTLSPEMIYAEVVVDVNGVRVKGVLKWDEKLRYPLMSLDI